MTPALLLAVAAAICAAAAVLDLAALAGARAARRPADHRPAARLLTRLGRRVGPLAAPRDLGARLAAAGAMQGVADVMARKTGAAAVALLLAPLPASAAPGRLGVVVLVALPAAAYLTPDLALRRRARRRGAQVARELPDVLELLRIAADAGLPPQRAAAEAGRRLDGLLPAELRRAAARAALGVPWPDVLDELERRCPAEGLPALVAALRRAHRHGTPLGPVLGALAADARARRAVAVRDHAARAAPKMQLVVALLLVPAVLLLVGAALVPTLV
jgi:tight adherence protein C